MRDLLLLKNGLEFLHVNLYITMSLWFFGDSSLQICISVCRAEAQSHLSALLFLTHWWHSRVLSSCKNMTHMERSLLFRTSVSLVLVWATLSNTRTPLFKDFSCLSLCQLLLMKKTGPIISLGSLSHSLLLLSLIPGLHNFCYFV